MDCGSLHSPHGSRLDDYLGGGESCGQSSKLHGLAGPRMDLELKDLLPKSYDFQGCDEQDGEQKGGDRVRRSILNHLQALPNYLHHLRVPYPGQAPPVTLPSHQAKGRGGTDGPAKWQMRLQRNETTQLQHLRNSSALWGFAAGVRGESIAFP